MAKTKSETEQKVLPETITHNGKQYSLWEPGMPVDGHFKVLFVPMDVQQVRNPKTGELFTSIANFKNGRAGILYGVDDKHQQVRFAITGTLSKPVAQINNACPGV